MIDKDDFTEKKQEIIEDSRKIKEILSKKETLPVLKDESLSEIALNEKKKNPEEIHVESKIHEVLNANPVYRYSDIRPKLTILSSILSFFTVFLLASFWSFILHTGANVFFHVHVNGFLLLAAKVGFNAGCVAVLGTLLAILIYNLLHKKYSIVVVFTAANILAFLLAFTICMLRDGIARNFNLDYLILESFFKNAFFFESLPGMIGAFLFQISWIFSNKDVFGKSTVVSYTRQIGLHALLTFTCVLLIYIVTTFSKVDWRYNNSFFFMVCYCIPNTIPIAILLSSVGLRQLLDRNKTENGGSN